MAEVKWIKITTDIFDDEKILLIESLPDANAIIVVWFKLLCLAGKQNNSGVFMMNDKIPYTEKMLSTIFRMKESTVSLALNTFEEFGMIELIDGVITIPNWGKHQDLDQLENRKKYMRNYMTEYREKQKTLTCKPNSKPNSKVNVNKADKEKEEEKEKEYIYAPKIIYFEKFCSYYPKKTKNILQLQEAYSAELLNNPQLAEMELVETARNYAEACSIKGTNEQYIKTPAKFITDGTYIDYLDGNYTRPAAKVVQKPKQNQFNNFEDRQAYNYDELEQLLGIND